MTDHLPQCWTQDMGGMKRASANSCAVCAALKSAIYDAIHEYDKQTYERCARHMRTARREALDAAREAVAALDAYYAIEECQGNPLEKGDPEDPDPWKQGHLIERDEALAAIDALRGESND